MSVTDRITFLAVSALLVVPGAARAQSTPDGAFVALDAAALATYRTAKDQLLAATDPYVVVAFDTLVIHHRGAVTKVPFTPPVYDRLKSIAHMALAVDGALAPYLATPPAGPLALDELTKLGERARTVDAVIDQAGLPPESASRQHRFIAATVGLVDEIATLAHHGGEDVRRAVQERLTRYAEFAGPVLLANATDAARAQIDGLDAAFRSFRARLSPEEWSRLYVVVLGVRMARAGNLQFGYFVNAMGRDAVDRRLIYAEGLTDSKAAESLLATIVTDRNLSATFFGDPMRMDRDLLADGAEARFLELFGKLGTK